MSFIKNVSMTFTANVLLFFIGIPTSIIIARILGPTGRGMYGLVFLIPSMLLLLGDFGIGMANTYIIGNNKNKIRALASNSLLFGAVNGLLFILIFLLSYELFLKVFFQEVPILFIYLVIVSLPFSLVSKYFYGILLAKLRIKEINYILILTSLLNFIGVTLLLIFYDKGIFSLILLSILITVINCLLSIYFVRKLTNINISFKPDVFKKTINFGVKASFANIFSFLNYRLDMLLINFFLSVTQVGYYTIAVGIAEMVWFVPNAIQSILFQNVSSSDNNSRQSEDSTALLCRNTLFVTLILCLSLAVFGKAVIFILFGSAYFPSVTPLLVLLPGIVMVSIGKIIAAYLSGKGRPIFAMYASMTSMVLNIILNILFIPLWGIAGAAFATTITYTIQTLMIFVAYLKISHNGLKNSLIVNLDDLRLYSNLISKVLINK